MPDKVTAPEWEQWIQEWSSPDFIEKGRKMRRNRLSETAGPGSGPSRHTCGSASFGERRRLLAKKLGRPPTEAEFFNDTHCKKNSDGSLAPIDARAAATQEALKKAIHSALYNEDETPILDEFGNLKQLSIEEENKIVIDVFDKVSKKHIYGTGLPRPSNSSVESDYLSSGASSRRSNMDEYDALRRELESTQATFHQMTEQIRQELEAKFRNDLNAQMEAHNSQVSAQVSAQVAAQVAAQASLMRAQMEAQNREFQMMMQLQMQSQLQAHAYMQAQSQGISSHPAFSSLIGAFNRDVQAHVPSSSQLPVTPADETRQDQTRDDDTRDSD